MKRKYGEGSLRMGTAVELSEDIYCITYLSMLRADYISLYLDIETGMVIPISKRPELKLKLQEKQEKAIADLKVKNMGGDSEPKNFLDPSKMSLASMGGQLLGGLKKGTNLVAGELVNNLKDLNEYSKPFTDDALEML